jgi:hypothetical protein
MEDVIPFLEQIAQPGCKVTLLIHYSVQGLDWFQDKSISSVVRERKLGTNSNTLLALEPLRERDVTVALDIYAGPLRKVVKQYTLKGDIDLVMIAARGKSWVGRVFQSCLLFLNFLPGSKSSSVLLLRPNIPKHEQ